MNLEALLLWFSVLHTINEIIQPALAALFVNVLSPEMNGLIKMQKIGCEATSLMEHITISEYLERTFKQNHKQIYQAIARRVILVPWPGT